MQFLGEWFRRLQYLLNRRRVDAALRQEMEAHRAEMGRPAGFGNVQRLREESHDVWGWNWLDHAVRDLRFAARALRRTPGFAVGAVLSLALGFALAATAVSVSNAYLLRSQPYEAAERVYYLRYAPPGPWEPGGMTALDWRSVSDVVEFAIASGGDTFYLSDGPYAQAVRVRRVTAGFIGGLGVRARSGRTLAATDFQPGAEPVALIGHDLWRERYGSDPGAIGRELQAENEAGRRERFRIVGVLPVNFYVGNDSRMPIEVIVPLTTPVRTYMVRLQRGVPVALAEQRITAAARAVARDLPADWTGVALESARERYAGEFRPVLIGVTAAAGLVLVIVCANVAVLIVLRTARRQKEIALRLSLGASRWQLGRMLTAEAALLCAGALVVGLLLTQWALGALAPMIERQLGRPTITGAPIAIDATVLLIVAGAGLLVTVSMSFLPLMLAWSGRLAEQLRLNSAATTDGRQAHRLRSSLLALEIAATLVLLVGCGLMIRSSLAMVRTDLGFNVERLARARIVLRAADYPDEAAFARFYQQFADRAPAAIAAPIAYASWPPFAAFPEHAIEIDDREGASVASPERPERGVGPPRSKEIANAGTVRIGHGYLATLGIALRAGRDFTRDEAHAAAPLAIISESLARGLWPGSTAIGRQLRRIEVTAAGPRPPGPWQTVVGIAADVRQGYDDTNLADVYSPGLPAGRYGAIYIGTDRLSAALIASLRSVAASLDPRAVIDLPRAVADENRELANARFLSTMLIGFGALAGFIAVLGIYSVTAYAVQQREREVAIRVALGAGRQRVVRLLLKDGSAVLATGLAVGAAGAVLASRALQNRIVAVKSFDLSTLLLTCALLAAIGLFAAWWPARRASSRSPLSALKDA